MNSEYLQRGYVTYEDFGAAGDAEHDDTQALYDTHVFANENHLKVKARWDANYYIGGRELVIPIETDTDWGSAHFVIDDRDTENNKAPIFLVDSRQQPVPLALESLRRDQKKLDVTLPWDCYVTVENSDIRHFIRFGPNQNNGSAQTDCFILRRDGTVDSPIDWDYDTFTSIRAIPMDLEPLTLSGGIFTTIANQGPSVYNYFERNILIRRSNTTVDGTVHYVCGELSHGCPYNGFIHAVDCANIVFRNLFSTGHKMYYTIGSAGVSVPMGSYDLRAGHIINFTMENCRTNNILDRSHWGTIATDFCKNILLDHCELSRIDTHQGVSGTYVLKNSSFGHMGIKAIGRGRILVENVTTYGPNLVEFRNDYGSTWEGSVEIRNTRYIPKCGETAVPVLFAVQNNGMHNFGYPCFMPESILIDGLEIADDHVPDSYQGPYVFSDPDAPTGFEAGPLTDPRPFPYSPTRTLILRNIRTHSGKKIILSLNPSFTLGK
ncbi:MAG: hypothetical protein II781_03770 [Clostridia bacterium]|nr:hypothetical protein [Clostridia bacterium]